MRNILLILFNFIAVLNLEACSCRGVSDYFSFFKNGTNLFVGQVVAISETSKYLIYEFKVLDKLRGNFKPTELVYSSKEGMCQLHVKTGKIYLIEVNEIRGKLQAGYCNFKEENTQKEFREDTALINLFGKKSFLAHSQYFRGRVENGKRVGKWSYYLSDTMQPVEEGNYVDGKKDGKWNSWSSEVYYSKGNFLKRIEIVSDSITAKVITTKKKKTMHRSDDSVWKIITKTKYMAFYSDGKVKVRASIKYGFLKEKWIYYDETGKITKTVNGLDSEGVYDMMLWFYDTKHADFCY